MGLIRDLLDVMLDTEVFFTEIKDRGKLDSIIYFAFISVIALIINWTLFFYDITPAGLFVFENLGLGFGILFYVPLIYFGLGFLLIILFSVITTKVLSGFGAKTEFNKVLKVIAYGFTPSILTLWIPFFGVIVLFWSLYLMSMGLGIYNSGELKTNIKACLVGGAITAVILIVALMGISFYFVSNSGGSIEPLKLFLTVIFPE